MALMMIFSNEKQSKCGVYSGFDCYQTNNIYQFLRYAKEAKPDLVVMHFEKKFNINSSLMNEIRKNLCTDEVCPRILLNPPTDFEGEAFFEKVDFEKEDIQKYIN